MQRGSVSIVILVAAMIRSSWEIGCESPSAYINSNSIQFVDNGRAVCESQLYTGGSSKRSTVYRYPGYPQAGMIDIACDAARICAQKMIEQRKVNFIVDHDDSTKCFLVNLSFQVNPTQYARNRKYYGSRYSTNDVPLFAAKANTGRNIKDLYGGPVDEIFQSSWGVYGGHYKSPLFDYWNDISFQTITFRLYGPGNEQAHITFNAVGADKESWFSRDRVVSTSSHWDAAYIKLTTWLHFSVVGYEAPNENRSFLIAKSYNGCENDLGLISLNTGGDGCEEIYHGDNDKFPGPRFVWSFNRNNKHENNFKFGISFEAHEIKIDARLAKTYYLYQ